MNPPMAPTASRGPTDEIAASGSPAFRNRLQAQAAVATVQISRMPVLLTVPETVIRSPITKPSDSNADGFNAGFDVRNSATKNPPSPKLNHSIMTPGLINVTTRRCTPKPPPRGALLPDLPGWLRPHLLSKLLLKLMQLGGNHELTIRLGRVVVVVELVVVLGGIELCRRLDGGDNGLGKGLDGVQSGDRFLRFLFLLRSCVVNHRSVLFADIVALPVYGGRVMHGKEHVQQIPIADLAGIKCDLHHFCVPRVAIAHLPVGRVVDVAAHVTRDG